MLSSEFLRILSVWSCHFDGFSAFDRLHFGNFVLVNFRLSVYYIYCVVMTLLVLFMLDQ